VSAVDHWEQNAMDPFRLGQNEGRGLITAGLREWKDYHVRARIRPSLMKSGGLAVRVQGLQRYYTLQLAGQKTIQLVRFYDGQATVLAEVPFDWQSWESYDLALDVQGDGFKGWVNGDLVLEFVDAKTPLTSGAIGLAVEEGFLMTDAVMLKPL
jgi:hypothetical protein